MKTLSSIIIGISTIVFLLFMNLNNVNAQLYINEFMASNITAYAGPQGDYPDWIEIYNAGDQDVMLGGYYFSDDLFDIGAMFQIPDTYPDSVTVEAGGFILFYANKDEDISVLNLDFKLSVDGEQIGFWDPDQVFVDSLTFLEQITDTSYGRYPDGSNNWVFMPDFTPGFQNAHISVINESVVIVALEQNFPNPFNEKTTIEFTLDKSDYVVLSVFDITGSLIKVLSDKILPAGKHQINWEAQELPSGLYFYSIKTSKNIVVKKATKF
ncbi:MAG: lamin tail domain-containing protein [Saprospiraceae bacterium]|nr:lamin tail domain-containing protein [Saprospiraceae bacterium]